jgi:hypothetical protein
LPTTAAEGELKPLFNGQNLTGWHNPYEWGEAQVVDGEIHLTADRKFFLVTDKTYADFIFEGEVLLPEGQANSGFMFRCHAQKNRVFGYQAEVDGSDRRWSGGLYDEGRRGWLWPSRSGQNKDPKALEHEAKSQAFFKQEAVRDAFKRNDWNLYRITCQDDRLIIEVNGVKVTDYRDGTDAAGHIAVQHHGEKGQTYRFRNLKIRELP